MTIAKKFLFGGLGMTGIASAGSSIGIHLKNDDSGIELKDFSHEQLVRKVGLVCGWSVGDGSECSIREGKKINLLIDNEKKIGFSPESNQTGKIKVYKTRSNGYKWGLRITIELGNIQLRKVEGEKTETFTMNEFEGYEIDRREDVWYLVRRDTVDQGKMRALGLPSSCTLPAGNNKTTCSISNLQIKEIEFEDRKGGAIIFNGKKVDVTIFKTNDNTIFGEWGYKFSFTSDQDITISNSNVVVKANTQTDFKIKKREGKLTLERAWDIGKLADKVGLECKESNVCTLKSEGKINVKQGNNRKIDIAGLSNGGTIKVLKDQGGYNQGFKFEIEGGDITFTGGSREASSSDVQKIWKDDSYEVIEEGGKYYFSRRDSGLSKKRESLGIPSKCFKRPSSWCDISLDELKKIKFYERNEGANLITSGKPWIQLKTFSTNEQSFSMGMKIEIKVNNGTIKIPLNNSKYLILWGGAEVEFKVKDPDGENPTIEKGFDMNALAKELGLGGECEDGIGCSFGRGKIKVMMGKNQEKRVKSEFANERIKYETGRGGWKRKVKFILEKDIEFEGSGKLEKGNYEISEKGQAGKKNIPYLLKETTRKQ